jgi:hypothetical protein
MDNTATKQTSATAATATTAIITTNISGSPQSSVFQHSALISKGPGFDPNLQQKFKKKKKKKNCHSEHRSIDNP